jgi:phosphotransferase system HPr-like phosphotransfer protein
LLSLGVTKNAIITVAAKGSDEDVALNALTTLVQSKFGE